MKNIIAQAKSASIDAETILGGVGGTGYTDLNKFIIDGLNLAVGAGAIICVGILIASGYMYITASGDEGKIEKATKSLTGALIGLAICFIAVLLVNFLLKTVLKVDNIQTAPVQQ